jgi:predicted dehydrogenase
MLGDPATEWVMGAVERKTDRFERNTRIEDCCLGVVQFQGGAQALVTCDLGGGANVENYSLRGSEGVLDVQQRGLRLLRDGGAGSRAPHPEAGRPSASQRVGTPGGNPSPSKRAGTLEAIDTGYEDPWLCQARELVTWLDGTSGYRGEGRQARATIEILMAIYQSARAHEVVRMPLAVAENPLDLMFAEGKLPVTEPGRYDIRVFLSFDPAERERYQAMRREGMHPREILKAMGRNA